MTRPVHVLVLVLHVEQPHASRTGQKRGGQLHPQQRRQPDRQVCDHERRNDARVGEVHAEPFAFAGACAEHAVAEYEQDGRANAEHDERVAEHAIEEPLRPGRRQVLVGRQRPHVANATPVQVAGGRVMLGVRALPLVEGRQREQPRDVAHDSVRAAGRKEGAVAAIVEDDEQPHQERRGRDRYRQGHDRGDPAGPTSPSPRSARYTGPGSPGALRQLGTGEAARTAPPTSTSRIAAPSSQSMEHTGERL